jgi:UDP-N-acetylmuramyl tripeptide synthase
VILLGWLLRVVLATIWLMLRSLLALFVGKLIVFLTQTLKLGGGSAAPGLYALKSDPLLIQKLAQQIPTNIIITGTNGKTTTARLLNQLLTKQGLKVVRNSTGSNLERGIASALLMKASFWGEIKNVDVGIWEVDEAAFNTLLPKIKPTVVVFLNAFRDQLDRYGEVDNVVKKWWSTLDQVDWPLQIITNHADVNTGYLGSIVSENKNIKNLGYQVKGHLMNQEVSMFVEMKKEFKADIEAVVTKTRGLDGSDFEISYPGNKIKVSLNLPGVYNIYNSLASFAVYYSLNLPLDTFSDHLKDFSPAFGRVEKLSFKGKEIILFLIKNPVGATQVFETVMPIVQKDDVLLTALNDNFADGTDVSWIWDAEFEQLSNTSYELLKMKGHQHPSFDKHFAHKNQQFKQIIVSGSRVYDLGIRLKYAQIDEKNLCIEPDLTKAFEQAVQSENRRIFMFLTYTAMLEMQRILKQKGAKNDYWKD